MIHPVSMTNLNDLILEIEINRKEENELNPILTSWKFSLDEIDSDKSSVAVPHP